MRLIAGMGITRFSRIRCAFLCDKLRDYRFVWHLLAAGVIQIIVGSPLARAGDWTFTPQAIAKEVYTDNVTLAPSGQEKSDFVTELTPGLAVHGKSRRLLVDLDYRLQNLLYADHSSFNKTDQLVRFNGTGTIWEHHLFFDAALQSRPQNIVSTGGPVSFDDISATGDRATVTSYTLTPRARERFGNAAVLNLKYSFDQILTNSVRLPESRSNQFEGHLQSGPRFTRLLWNLNYRNQRINNQGAFVTKFENVRGRLQYMITPHIGLIGEGGYDNDSYGGPSGTTSGPLWSLGASWTPTERSSIEATAGRRYFGTTFSLNLRHKTRLTDWVATYTEEPTTTRQFLLEQQVFPVFDAFGNPVINPGTGEPVLLNVNVPVQTTEVLILKRFSTTFSITGRVHTLQLHFFDEARDYQLTGDRDTSMGGTATLTWDLGERTTSKAVVGWSTNKLRSGERDNYPYFDIGVTRELGKTLDATLGYRYVQRRSNIAQNNFTENRVTFVVNKVF